MLTGVSSFENLGRLRMFKLSELSGNKVVFVRQNYAVIFTILSAGVIKLQVENDKNYFCEKVVDIRSFAEIDYSSKNFKEQLAEFLAKEIRFLNVNVMDFNGNYVCEVFFQVGKTRYLVNLLMRKPS